MKNILSIKISIINNNNNKMHIYCAIYPHDSKAGLSIGGAQARAREFTWE